MFADLHEGILEVFADAQRAQHLAWDDRIEEWSARVHARRADMAATRRARAAAPRVAPRVVESAEERQLRQRASRAERRRAWKAQAALKLREVRSRRVAWTPPRPRVEVNPCGRCGAPVERREGYKAPIGHRCAAEGGAPR